MASQFRACGARHENTDRRASFCLVLSCLFTVVASSLASCETSLGESISRVFVGRSFTIRNFYKGSHLRYGSDGALVGKQNFGYWSRDGMVEITSVKIPQENQLVFQGRRQCLLLDSADGEFSNVWTGDNVELQVELTSGQHTVEDVTPILRRVFVTGTERLADLVPSYWADCLSRKVDRPDKRSPWECITGDRERVPDFRGKKTIWETPPPDTSLHNGTQLYNIRHQVGYLTESRVTIPTLLLAPDPLFQWGQRRTTLGTVIPSTRV